MGEVFKGKFGCEVEVILDSVSPDYIRLTTVRLRYWRPIHSELMTHRVFSRNARSSRAVPVTTLLKEDPFFPEFQRNKPGMQAAETLPEEEMNKAYDVWRSMIEYCRAGCKMLHELDVHKQWANRPLEWFGWIDVLVTSTDWANWFALRDHPAAAPEIHDLAETMDRAFAASIPQDLYYGQWHLPYIIQEDRDKYEYAFDDYTNKELIILSAARCARISYKPFDGDASPEKEKARYDNLVSDRPVHASPTEHQATPDIMLDIDLGKGQNIKVWSEAAKQGNFVGWKQHRKEIPDEAVMESHHYA